MRIASFFNKKRVLIILLLTAILLAATYSLSGRLLLGATPEITCTEGNLKVKVEASDKQLLSGMIATDKEDGDITDRIIVESYSDFKAPGIRDVNYAVMDSDNNVAKFSRTIEYTDYHAPKLKLKANPVIGINQKADLLPFMGAKDEIDGNLSGKVRLISSNVDSSQKGDYEQKYAVTNSAGDVAEVLIKVTVTDDFSGQSPVELKKYIIYLDKGESFDYNSLIKKSPGGVSVVKKGDFSKSGICYVNYYAGSALCARLTVIVQ